MDLNTLSWISDNTKLPHILYKTGLCIRRHRDMWYIFLLSVVMWLCSRRLHDSLITLLAGSCVVLIAKKPPDEIPPADIIRPWHRSIMSGSSLFNSSGPSDTYASADAGTLLLGTIRTKISEILTKIKMFSFKKMHYKLSSAKWRPFCRGLSVLLQWGWDKIAVSFQLTFFKLSNSLSCMSIVVFCISEGFSCQ